MFHTIFTMNNILIWIAMWLVGLNVSWSLQSCINAYVCFF